MARVYDERRRWSCHVLYDLWLKEGPIRNVHLTGHNTLRGHATHLVFERHKPLDTLNESIPRRKIQSLPEKFFNCRGQRPVVAAHLFGSTRWQYSSDSSMRE